MSNKAAFNALAPNYDGEASVHSLEFLQEQLLSAACTVMRVDEQDAAEATDDAEGAVLGEVLLKVGQRSTNAGSVSTAPLTEDAHQQAAALLGNHEMKAFAHRILNSEARNVGNAGELTGAIHFYSGSRECRTCRGSTKSCAVLGGPMQARA